MAGAASTRAEYVAQVDPICQANLVPVRSSGAKYHSDLKRMIRLATAGKVKLWLRQTNRTATSVDRYAAADETMIDQIATVPPPVTDSAAVNTWVNGVKQANVYRRSAASALRQLKIAKFAQFLRQIGKAWGPAYAAISDFGFQVCYEFV